MKTLRYSSTETYKCICYAPANITAAEIELLAIPQELSSSHGTVSFDDCDIEAYEPIISHEEVESTELPDTEEVPGYSFKVIFQTWDISFDVEVHDSISEQDFSEGIQFLISVESGNNDLQVLDQDCTEFTESVITL